MDAIERIEIAIRVDLAYTLGKKNPFAYAKSEFLHGNFTKKIQSASGKTGHALWLEKYQQRLARANEDFVKHFKFKYGLPLPIWVSVELWDFGMLSHFYQGLHVEDKQSISIKYGLDDWRVMQSWLRTINHIRNIAAHHGRLWNKNLIDQPKLPKASSISGFDGINITRSVVSRVYFPLCILLHLLDRISPHSSWRDRTRSLLKSFPSGPGLSLNSMGCPADWELHWIWRTKT